MEYKIHYEPLYIHECRSILNNIVNGTTFKDDMEEFIEKRGLQSKRSAVEELFQKSIKLEKYFKEKICLNLPGFEETGQEMAELLFKKFKDSEDEDVIPFDAFRSYDSLLSSGIDNKAAIILYGLDILEDWGFKEMEMGNPPPLISDSEFFGFINKSYLEQEAKLRVLNLYFEFSTYHTYAHALLQHAEELLKNKVHEYANEIEVHMDFVEKNLLLNNSIFSKNRLDVLPSDDQIYHVYPGLYCVNDQTLSWVPQSSSPANVIIGMAVFQLEKLSDSVELDNAKTTQFLNCLSDSTKQTILQLLRNESLYGSQLAEKLNCTGANISQHMSTLSNLGVVHAKKENNRLYFYLNKDVIHKYLEDAKGLFG